MHTVWKKMQVKEQKSFLILAPPKEFDAVLTGSGPGWNVEKREDISPLEGKTYDTLVIFVTDEKQIHRAADVLRRNAARDSTLVWICYPKKSSKNYKTEIDRDHGWDSVTDLGWKAVRQVAVDNDWSALRFRPEDAVRK